VNKGLRPPGGRRRRIEGVYPDFLRVERGVERRFVIGVPKSWAQHQDK